MNLKCNWNSSSMQIIRALFHLLAVYSAIIISIVPVTLSNNPEKRYQGNDDLKMVTLPASKKHTATIIFLQGHSYYDSETGKDWASVLGQIQQPYTKVICPTPYSMAAADISLKKFYKYWYYLQDLCQEVSIIDGPTQYIHSLIQQEIKNGIPAKRILIGGSGEGGVLAINCAARYPEHLGALVAVSTTLPHAMQTYLHVNPVKANRNIRILQCDLEPTTEDYHQTVSESLKKISPHLEAKLYNETSKLLPDQGIEDFKKFFVEHIPPK